MDHHARHLVQMTRGYLTAAAQPPGTRMHTVPARATLCCGDVPEAAWRTALDACTQFAAEHSDDIGWFPARITGYHLWMSQHADPGAAPSGFLLLRHPEVPGEPGPGEHIRFHTPAETMRWWHVNQSLQRLHAAARALHPAPDHLRLCLGLPEPQRAPTTTGSLV